MSFVDKFLAMENNILRPLEKVPPAEELLKKIHELELGHAQLKQEMSGLATSSASKILKAGGHCKRRSFSSSPQRWRKEGKVPESFNHHSLLQRESHIRASLIASGAGVEQGRGEPPPMRLTDKQYLNILQSMGQSVHIMDQDYRLVFWNQSAEDLYGFSAPEALGRSVFELLVDPVFFTVGSDILTRLGKGESWTGQFPVTNKRGDRFSILATDTPLFDDAGNFIGVICVSSDSRSFKAPKADSSLSLTRTNSTGELGLDHYQQPQGTIASKIQSWLLG